ncbi:hypothetical protein ABTX60_07260 [Streptomyces sp. NPDC126510]|uniref:hypothetical protein n=1 Tax=Streptomyces sp. NPDC126510 TaxID=3155317 RepID=UPI003321CB73
MSGQRNAGTLDLLTVPQSTPLDVPSSDITLPEAGVYELTADLLFIASWNFTGRHVAAIVAQWFNVTTGTNVPGSNRWWVHDDPGGSVGAVGLASVWENVVVRALVSVTVPTTFRLRGIRGTGNGSAATTANVQHAIQQNGGASQNLIVWRKLAD